MPVYQIDIEKSYSPSTGTTVYWTNVYYADVASAAAAITTGNAVVAAEKGVHLNTVSFTKMRTRLAGTTGNTGTITPLSGAGSRAPSNALPLFDVTRVDFAVPVGRPNRKYLRGTLNSGDMSNGALTATWITAMSTGYISQIMAIGTICDSQGQAVTSGTTYPYVGMRQLRRGSKRKTTPVI